MKTRLIIICITLPLFEKESYEDCHILFKESEHSLTASTTTTKREHLNKWLWKRAVSYSQNVIGYITRLMCWWPCRFNYLLKHWMNYTASHHCRTMFIGQIHCWHKQTELDWLPLDCYHLFQQWAWLASPVAWIQSPLKSMERACDFKGLWIMSGVPCVLPATELVILQITMYIHLVSWHILTGEWGGKCIPSSKYSISVTQAHI